MNKPHPPLTAAEKFAIILEFLIAPEPYLDEATGEMIHPEPLITIEQAKRILDEAEQ